MKSLIKTTLIGAGFVLVFLLDLSPRISDPGLGLPELRLVPEAHAILGVRRRTARRTAVVVGGAASASAYAAGEATAAAQQQAAAAPPPQYSAPAPAPAAPQPAGAPALGTVVSSLPNGCSKSPQGGVEYYNCGGVYYRAAFQGSNLVYVVSQP